MPEIVDELFLEVLLPEAHAICEHLHGLSDPGWDDVRVFVERAIAHRDRHEVILDVLQQAHAVEREEMGQTWSFALTDTASVLARYLETVLGVEAETARARAIMLIGLLDRFWFFSRLPGVEVDRSNAPTR